MGIIIAWASLIGSVLMEGGELNAFFLLPSAVLVFGGTFGAALTGISMTELKELPAKTKLAFFSKEPEFGEIIKQIVEFSTRARRDGILSLENDIEQMKDPFMQKGFQLAIDGTDLDNLRDIMEQEIQRRKTWVKEGEEFYKQLGGFAPTLGVIGTVCGLIHMLANLENASSMGPAIAAAFIATLYGVSFANLLFIPVANKIKNVYTAEILARKLILEGVVSIQSGTSIRTLESRLTSLVPDHKKK
jgi:chemotaxis protein MotA